MSAEDKLLRDLASPTLLRQHRTKASLVELLRSVELAEAYREIRLLLRGTATKPSEVTEELVVGRVVQLLDLADEVAGDERCPDERREAARRVLDDHEGPRDRRRQQVTALLLEHSRALQAIDDLLHSRPLVGTPFPEGADPQPVAELVRGTLDSLAEVANAVAVRSSTCKLGPGWERTEHNVIGADRLVMWTHAAREVSLDMRVGTVGHDPSSMTCDIGITLAEVAAILRLEAERGLQ